MNRESKLDRDYGVSLGARVDIERVLIPEKRCDNDAHVIAYFRARRIYIRSVSLFALRKIVQNKSWNVIECREKVYK